MRPSAPALATVTNPCQRKRLSDEDARDQVLRLYLKELLER
jgi:hypothetical protein